MTSHSRFAVTEITQYFRKNDSSSVIVSNLSRELQKRGHFIAIATPDPHCMETTSFKVITATAKPLPFSALAKSIIGRSLLCTLFYFPLFIKLVRYVTKTGYNVVFAHHHNFHLAAFSAFVLSRISKNPHVVFIHDLFNSSPTGSFIERASDVLMILINRSAMKSARLIFAQSQGTKEEIRRTFGIDERRIMILPNCVDVSYFQETQNLHVKVGLLREKYGIGNRKVMLFLGTMSKGRGVDIILKSIPEIKSKGYDILAMLVGRVNIRDELDKTIRDLGIQHNVVFVGEVPHEDVLIYLSVADVAIGPLEIPPTRCTLPVKVLEYMAAGKPTIAIRYSVPEELIIHGFNGLLLSKSDEKEFANAVLYLLANAHEAERLASNAHKYVLQNYGVELVVDRLEKALSSLTTHTS